MILGFERSGGPRLPIGLGRGRIRDGIVLKRVLKKHSMEAQVYCLAAGVLVGEGWLSMVMVQGQIKGFIRAYAKAAPKENVLQFPIRNCEDQSAHL
jgi:hypothetical protein